MIDHNQVVALLDVAGRPVHVIELATALGEDAKAVVEVIDHLTETGLAVETAEGISIVEGLDSVSSPAHRELAAEQWAKALVALGADSVEAGLAFERAGDHGEALRHLLPAALTDHRADAIGALLTTELEKRLSDADRGRLHLARATYREKSGDSAGAAADLGIATRHLDGEELVDALGYAASVADDVQRPQQSETLASLAVGKAHGLDDPAKEGSLLTLHARQLSRIGFPDEADHVLARGLELVESHGTDIQWNGAKWNKAWMHLDRGEAREAESLFGSLRDQAIEGEEIDRANREVYWARSLFAIGEVEEALSAADRAEELALRLGARAPEFLTHLARAEGAIWFHRYHDALEHAEGGLGVVRDALPAWHNVLLVAKSRALSGLSQEDAARQALDDALEATPPGPDGWRLRIQASEALLAVTPATEPWPQHEAENLTDELLRSRWFASAARLMITRAHREQDSTLGLEAAGLATQLGNPMLAADAIEAANAWDQSEALPVARSIKAIEAHVPKEWHEQWLELPAITAALSLETSEESDPSVLLRHIDEALTTAGLAGADVVLSPAQRAASGVVRRRPRRERRLLTGVLQAAAVVVLAIGSVFLFDRLTEPPPGPIPIEEIEVPRPANGVFGAAPYRGGPERTGVVEESIRTVTGYYWRYTPGGFFGAPPVAFGSVLYLASSTRNELLYVSQDIGRVNFPIATGDGIRSPPGFDPADPMYLVFGADDGRVYAGSMNDDNSPWPTPKDVVGRVSASPIVIGDTVVVATESGQVRAISLIDPRDEGGLGPGSAEGSTAGPQEWTYTGSELVSLSAVSTSPASDSEHIYVVADDAFLHVIDFDSGTAVCEPIPLNGFLAPGTSPIISAGHVYLPAGDFLDRLEIGTCTLKLPLPTVLPGLFLLPPVIDEGVMYAVEGPRLWKFDVSPNAVGLTEIWESEFATDGLDPISTPPTLAGDVVYFGTRQGIVYAIDASSGRELWTFSAGARVEGLAPVRNAVFVTTADGVVTAIAGE